MVKLKSFIHSFSKYLSAYYVPGAGKIIENKRSKLPDLRECIFYQKSRL